MKDPKPRVTQGMLHGLERRFSPLGRNVSPTDLVNGDLCSLHTGHVVPLRESLPFGGIVNGVGQQGGQYWVSTLVRGTISVQIAGLTPDVTLGCPVYATVNGRAEAFSLEEPGTPIGELVDIEDVEQRIGRIRIDVGGDRLNPIN